MTYHPHELDTTKTIVANQGCGHNIRLYSWGWASSLHGDTNCRPY